MQDIFHQVHRQLSGKLGHARRRRVLIAQQRRLDFIAERPFLVARHRRRQKLGAGFSLERLHDPHFSHLRIGQRGLHDALFSIQQQSSRHSA